MMKIKLSVLLFFCSSSVGAVEPEYAWKYPCDVFLPGVCTRMPAEAELTYSVPADFGMYRMTNAAGPVLVIYTGLSPARKPSESPVLSMESSGVLLSAYAREEAGVFRVDIFIERSRPGTLTTHIFGNLSHSSRAAFGQFVGGLRPCTSSKYGAFRCQQREEWGVRLAALVNHQARTGQASKVEEIHPVP